MECESMDNLSVVILSFHGFSKFISSLKTNNSSSKDMEVFSSKGLPGRPYKQSNLMPAIRPVAQNNRRYI
jgi:hypothetical protein